MTRIPFVPAMSVATGAFATQAVGPKPGSTLNVAGAGPVVWVRHAAGIAAVLLVMGGHAAQASQLSTEQSRKDDERSLSRRYSQCVEASGGSDLNMKDCTNEERYIWDQRLNKAYQAILERNRDKTGLRNQERVWIKERDAKCTNDDPQRGTIDALNEADCLLIETVDRALVLEAILRRR